MSSNRASEREAVLPSGAATERRSERPCCLQGQQQSVGARGRAAFRLRGRNRASVREAVLPSGS
ncbi:hypothetical protein EYF80_063347 [Liparis tanakae]|uniref:Uncharacterized protein n=1 Tax=Liparis tanakae TaxID=230148 RepID=A0A4Z2EC93_9TELE|nr:hypothetical protein EYF80_063347 [Liparis tanakae]